VERPLSTETIFDGRFLTVRVDEIENEDGHRSTREVVATRGAAAVVCVHGSDLVLVRQYRYPVGRTLLEIPAGLVDEIETPEQAAARELVEEVGLRPRSLEHLVSYFAAPGFTNHAIEIFFTDDVEETETDPDDGEVLEIVRRPLEKIRDLITNGEVSDAKTLIGLALIALRI
jgi:ADP-ribose pyrophosphatase